MIEQRSERGGAVPWILDERGRRTRGYDDGRRLAEVRAGLVRHRGVTARHAPTRAPSEIELTLRPLHEPDYLRGARRACAATSRC